VSQITNNEPELHIPRINYVLVDHENVQPTDIALLDRTDVRLYVFVGARQAKLLSEIAIPMQEMGERAKYVRASAVGANALDFHIAYYVGRLVTLDPAGLFYIISKDKGYDPLLAHLQAGGVHAKRLERIAEIPLFKKKSAVVGQVVSIAKVPVPGGNSSAKSVGLKSVTAASSPPPKTPNASRHVRFIVEPAPPAVAAPAVSTKKTASKVGQVPVSELVQKSPVAAYLADSKAMAQRWMKVRTSLKKSEGNRPSSVAALKKHIKAQFSGDDAGQAQVESIVAELINFELVVVAGNGKLTWNSDKF